MQKCGRLLLLLLLLLLMLLLLLLLLLMLLLLLLLLMLTFSARQPYVTCFVYTAVNEVRLTLFLHNAYYPTHRCVAQVSEEAFAPYYAAFMPGIKQILATAVAPEQALLRGKAMECAGLLGEAVGAAVFAPDALELMTMLAAAMVSQTVSGYLESLWLEAQAGSAAVPIRFYLVNICFSSILPLFLPLIIPPLLSSPSCSPSPT